LNFDSAKFFCTILSICNHKIIAFKGTGSLQRQTVEQHSRVRPVVTLDAASRRCSENVPLEFRHIPAQLFVDNLLLDIQIYAKRVLIIIYQFRKLYANSENKSEYICKLYAKQIL